MRNSAVIYRSNGMDFLRLEFPNKNKKPYSLGYLEKLAGFRLADNAPEILFKYGFIRVCKDVGSYRLG